MASKKDRKNQINPTTAATTHEIITDPIVSKPFNLLQFLKEDWIGLVCFIATVIGAYCLSRYSDGFYQGEEATHYVNMKNFWNDPNSILGASLKTGFKILFVIPAYFGEFWTRLLQCIIVGLIAYFTYRVAKLKNLDYPFLAFFIFASSCLWTGVSYRYYPEVLSALLLILGIFLHYRYPSQKHWAAIVFGYLLIVRGEFMIVAALYFVILLLQKQWKAIIFLGIFPFLYNLWGFIQTGDFLFMIHSQSEYAASVKNSYQKAGFDHYFVMSGIIFGYICVIGTSLYMFFCLIRKIKIDWYLFIPFIVFFFLQCLINWKERNILTSTGGNVRYMMAIFPLVVLMTMMAFQRLFEINKRFLYLFYLIPIVGFIAYTQTYEHNWIERARWLPRNPMPFYFSIGFIILLIIPWRNKHIYFPIIGIASIVAAILFIKPIKLVDSGENYTAKQIVEWVRERNYQNSRMIYQNLPTFNYFFDKTYSDYPMGCTSMTPAILDTSRVGSIVIWESHFAQKFGGVEKAYFDQRQDKYLALQQYRSPDNRVDFIIYERVNK